MSTAARSWSVRTLRADCKGRGRRCRFRAAVIPRVAFVCFVVPIVAIGQISGSASADNGQGNRDKAHQVLAAAIQALGGAGWLDLRTWRTEGNTAAFFHGRPTGQIQSVTVTTALPERQRFDIGHKGRVVHLFTNGHGWEITYKGKKPLSKADMEEHQRWRDHSLGMILRQWYGNPATILLYDGPSMVERHAADKVTLINSANDAVTLEIATDSHLPLRLSLEWRDPRFGDKNIGTVEYDNYEHIDGVATPFTITRTVNGETVWERFVKNVAYNVALGKDDFDPDAIAAHLK